MNETKELYLKACSKIFDKIENHGFKYFKSGPLIKKYYNDLTFQISFQSSYRNLKDYHISLIVFGQIISKNYTNWLKTRNNKLSNGYIITANIGNLTDPPHWMEWNIANNDNFDNIIDDIVNKINNTIFPIYKIFEDKNNIINTILNKNVPVLFPANMIEYIYYLDGLETAKYLFDKYVVDFNINQEEMLKKVSDYQKNGIPNFSPIDLNTQFAFVKVSLDI